MNNSLTEQETIRTMDGIVFEQLRKEQKSVKVNGYNDKIPMAKDIISKTVFNDAQYDEWTQHHTSPQTMVDYNLVPGEQFQGVRLNYFDRIVYSAFASLYEVGTYYVKLSTIYRTMTGNKDAKLTPEIASKISRSVTKLRTTLFEFDIREEIERMNLPLDVEEGEISANLLHLDTIRVKGNGEHEEYYEIMKEPILFFYAKLKKQILRIPLTHLKVPKLRLGDSVHLDLVYILYEEIDLIKRGKRNAVINYETLFNRLGIDVNYNDNTTKVQIKRVRKNIAEKILPYWVEQGFIVGFENHKCKTGKKINGIRIKK